MNRTLGLRWDLSATEVTKLTAQLTASYTAVIDRIAGLAGTRVSKEAALLPLAEIDGEVATASIQCFGPAFCFSKDKDTRAASAEAKKQLRAFWTSIFERHDLYQVFKRLDGSAERATFDEQEDRLLRRLMRDFERAGQSLEEGERKRLAALRAREGTLCSLVEQTINEDTSVVECGREELLGLPDSFFEPFPADDATLRIGLKFPEVAPILKFAQAEGVRKRVETARLSRCLENAPVLAELFGIRHDAAKLLGYPNHAEYILAAKMAGSVQRVQDFADGITDPLLPKAKEEAEAMRAFKGQHTGDADCALHAWDKLFFGRLQREAQFDIDEEAISEYFPLNHVLAEMMAVYGEILGLEFAKLDDGVWDEHVMFYECRDATSHAALGHFFLDLFPRPGKFGHQCVIPIRPAYRKSDGTQQTPCAALVGNLPKPTATRPSLLRHQMVTTVFHEFGHVLHCVLSNVRFSRFAWAWSAVPYPGGVEYDFLEAPSMMFENWVWEPAVLKRLSSHFEDAAKKLPDEEVSKLLQLRRHNQAWQECRYFGFALFDLCAHSDASHCADPTGQGLNSLVSKLSREYGLLEPIEGTNFLCSFYHMVQGYDTGYYGYAWAEAYGMDMFSVFKATERGCLDPEVGARLRKLVLSVGASQDGMAMLRGFLGREPSTAAFLESLGIKAG